ncbi:TIGR03862 family flavoprotein [Aliiruegeria sabulilitoris]|uniref:TIGR03862 family flavoprotein n=1 Tax=Aliiruegeria sabulilitoris TaxID=1510458 RepID=UPI0009E6D0DF|nr:TIGR03862 family flavoprotein [Aliiruegeria sabulilitoris]NDR58548.1 TIGR03862 family flavoprotein [Pseudoruegeria sp. M32A2M]
MNERVDALIVGAGPAGLMAAESLADAGHSVIVAEAKPSAGRKLLMAGKSGLNLTKDEPAGRFLYAYAEAAAWLAPMLAQFGQQDVKDWAEALGSEIFTGSAGRVFPKEMKASPLLRAWLRRLGEKGVALRTRWRWTGWDGAECRFDTPDGPQGVRADATVLAFGGASWARLGSDGAWAAKLQAAGIGLDPFAPSNVGLCVDWSPHIERYFGAPVKGVALVVGEARYRGEFVISRHGLEGSGIYAVSRPAREGRPILIDLLPDWPVEKVQERLSRPRGKASISNHLRKSLHLDAVKVALLREFGGPLPDGAALAQRIKALPLAHDGPRPMDEAISVAGGVRRDALDDHLMLKQRPGVFCAGEMLSWEAPTGGYLLTACLSTGLWAGRGAAEWLERSHDA